MAEKERLIPDRDALVHPVKSLPLAVLMAPDEQVSRYIGGEVVSYFTNATVFETDEGAADCAGEAAAQFGECLDLAEAFGTVFIDPAAVTCATVAFPQVAQGSFATNLTGTIRAGEFDVNLTIMIVAFNMGNVSAVVGSAAAFDPPVDDMITQVTLVTDRIGQAQAAE